MLIEMVTKHYEILGERTPIELTFYDNGDGCKVVANHHTLNLTVSTSISEDMDDYIISNFEKMISINRSIRKMKNTHSNKITHKITLIENPDDLGEDSLMIGWH